MERIIAYCGLVCTECAAYIATQANDQAGLEQVAAKWREEFNAPQLTAESLICDGCVGDGRHTGNCYECQIRACCVERGLANCAHCTEYVCEKLEGTLGVAPAARATLDEIRRSL